MEDFKVLGFPLHHIESITHPFSASVAYKNAQNGRTRLQAENDLWHFFTWYNTFITRINEKCISYSGPNGLVYVYRDCILMELVDGFELWGYAV